MTPRLIEPTTGPATVREIALDAEQFLIGRGEDCDLRLHVSEISRHHCLLLVQGRAVAVADLGSSNGTFLNGKRVISQTALRTGDEIRVGPYRFFVDLGDDPAWKNQFFSDSTDPRAATERIHPRDAHS
jgi:pSer/pThr/pTyr-binding forkhead associated (FHA) protein